MSEAMETKYEEFYEVLELKESATLAEIRQRFKQKSLEIHPDRAGHEATSRFQALNNAHQKLLNTGQVVSHVRSQSNLRLRRHYRRDRRT